MPSDAGAVVDVPRLPRLGAVTLTRAGAAAGADGTADSWHGELAEPPAGAAALTGQPSRAAPRPPPASAARAVGRSAAAYCHCRSSTASSSCMRSPGTLRWISAFGSRSATIDGASSSARRSEIVKVRVRMPPTATQLDDAADLVTGALDEHPARLQARGHRSQAASTSDSSYWRSTLKARMTAGRRSAGSGTSKPPSANETRRRGRTRLPARTARAAPRRRAPGRGRSRARALRRPGAPWPAAGAARGSSRALAP